MGRHLRENEPRDPSTERRTITFACGCCILTRAEVFRAIGGFDESYFTYVEDLEFSIRAQASGYKILYEPTAIVLHRIGRQAPPTPRQIVLRDTNRRRMVTRHYSAAEKVAFGIWFYPTRAIHFMRYLARGDWPRVRAILTGALSRIDYATSRTQLSFAEPSGIDQRHSART
jgi:GT2 family glycosyltransferase